jgi:hypothetical protein
MERRAFDQQWEDAMIDALVEHPYGYAAVEANALIISFLVCHIGAVRWATSLQDLAGDIQFRRYRARGKSA